MNKIKTILVEDEPLSLLYAAHLIADCPQVVLAGTANTQDKAVALIKETKPDVLLLDVELHGGNGFEVLKQTTSETYNVIFTTAIFDAAINIIKLSGVEVLQKPLEFETLKQMMENFADPEFAQAQAVCFSNLLSTLRNQNIPLTIALKCKDNVQHIILHDIQNAELQENTLLFFLENGKVLKPEKDIKYYEILLSDFGFFRVNANSLVNLKHVKKDSLINDSLSLTGGSKIDLSPKKKESFLNALQKI